MADLEYGMFAQNNTSKNQNDPTQTSKYVTAILKNNGTTEFALRGGNAASGSLATYYKGALPGGWSPMKLQGAIVLGSGGDCCKPGGGANLSIGTFYEGAIVFGYPADSTENAIQANIVSAGYGSNKVSAVNSSAIAKKGFSGEVRCISSNKGAVIGYSLADARHVSVNIFDQRGRRIAAVVDGIFPAGNHEAVWNAGQVPAGVYVCRLAVNGMAGWIGKIVIGK
jgi:hypothetical protein